MSQAFSFKMIMGKQQHRIELKGGNEAKNDLGDNNILLPQWMDS